MCTVLVQPEASLTFWSHRWSHVREQPLAGVCCVGVWILSPAECLQVLLSLCKASRYLCVFSSEKLKVLSSTFANLMLGCGHESPTGFMARHQKLSVCVCDNSPLPHFPSKLLESLLYCWLAQRVDHCRHRCRCFSSSQIASESFLQSA